MKRSIKLFAVLLFVFALNSLTQAQTSAFTFQGRLNDNSLAANGSYQMQFSLYNAVSGGTQIGSTIENTSVNVINGVFTTPLDFGTDAFDGNDRFIEIAVRRNDTESYVTLNPRQAITSAPYSVRANKAATADVATTALNANNADTLDGIDSSQFVQGNVVRSVNNFSGDTFIVPGNNISISSNNNSIRINAAAALRSITTRYSNQSTISPNNIQKFVMRCNAGEFPIGGGHVMLDAINSGGLFALRVELLHSGPAFEDPGAWVIFIRNTTDNTGTGYYYITCARSN